jgi:hypothetical protein
MMNAPESPAGAYPVHLVGSVPLSSADEVFRAVTGALGSRIRRLPDGETGDRTGWVGFQVPVLMQHPLFELAPSDQPGEDQSDVDRVTRAVGTDYTRPFFALRAGADASTLEFGDLGYARAALESYAVFARLKTAGVITPGTRFQVSLPTPLAPLVMFVSRRDHRRVEPAYKTALLRELTRICAAIPHDELAVQWDVAPELALLEGTWESGFDDVEGEIVARVTELGNAVPATAELGFHLCYGDLGHQHFVQPRDMSVLVRLASGVAAGLQRPLNWVHMPVPADRDDDAYFAPLRALQLPAGAQLFLGLVHATDGIDGARRRAAAARRFSAAFGIATECGFGRRPPQTVPALLDLHRVAADELAGPASTFQSIGR